MTTTTTRRDLPPRYDAAVVEPPIYERWLESGAFTPAVEPPPGAERFVIIMPPPNVTGALHNGHAVFVTLEDTMIRYHRMRGDDTLWLPGVDHASIAAQSYGARYGRRTTTAPFDAAPALQLARRSAPGGRP